MSQILRNPRVLELGAPPPCEWPRPWLPGDGILLRTDTRGPQQPAPFPLVFEAHEGYVLIRPVNALRDPIDAAWPRP